MGKDLTKAFKVVEESTPKPTKTDIDFSPVVKLKITQELLLSKNSEETYMEHYLGIPVKKGLFKSPLRKDNKPTCAFYRDSAGRLVFKDFRGDFYGNFIEVVKYKYNVSYHTALNIIANDFGICKFPELPVNKSSIKEYTNNKFEQTEGSVIRVKVKDFTEDELKWWGQYGIGLKTLKNFYVFSLEFVYLNDELYTYSTSKNFNFGYYRPNLNKDKQLWRIYYPQNRVHRFISNWNKSMIQGWHMLPKNGDILVITKSMKDVMTLYELGITAIAPTSENLFITDAQYDKLVIRFKYLFLFYDNDRAGISNMNKIRKKFKSIIPVFIPFKYKVKDISDFYKRYGNIKTFDLIQETKNYYING